MALPATLLVGPIFEVANKLLDHFFPNAEQKDAAKLKLLELAQNGDLAQMQADVQLALGQLEVNKAEAMSAGFFRGGWRPFIGWVCGAGLSFQFVIRPIANWTIAIQGNTVFLPGLEMETLMTLLFGMLGLGAYRTLEKTKGLE